MTLSTQTLHHHSKVLTLDVAGMPRKWVDLEQAIEYYAKDKVAWEIGDFTYTMRGGIQRTSGIQSEITTRSIIALKGTENIVGKHMRSPPLTRRLLFARDHHICAYCGEEYTEHKLEQEHIIPVSQGGKTTWMNIITACVDCNDYKGSRTPEQADMPLRYLPYVPNRAEALLLMNRHILEDQQELLLAQTKNLLKYRPIFKTTS